MFIVRFLLVFIIFGFLLDLNVLHAKVRNYATNSEILESAFPGAEIEKRRVKLTPEMRKEIETLIKRRFFMRRFSFYVAKRGGETLGYAAEANEIGKTKPITFMVILDKKGVVKRIDILVFRETQGYEIKNPRWRKQFVGKSLRDPFRLKRDIDNISGATLSSRAVTKGVKKVLAVFKVVRQILEE